MHRKLWVRGGVWMCKEKQLSFPRSVFLYLVFHIHFNYFGTNRITNFHSFSHAQQQLNFSRTDFHYKFTRESFPMLKKWMAFHHKLFQFWKGTKYMCACLYVCGLVLVFGLLFGTTSIFSHKLNPSIVNLSHWQNINRKHRTEGKSKSFLLNNASSFAGPMHLSSCSSSATAMAQK